MKYKDIKENITLLAPTKPEEEISCQERIHKLAEEIKIASDKNKNKELPQNYRDYQIHELKYLAKRLLWELGGN